MAVLCVVAPLREIVFAHLCYLSWVQKCICYEQLIYSLSPTFAASMSDPIKHECGLAFIRLRKSFSYYQQQYGTVLWGLNKLYLLMEKQHNRGQDGAGVATVKLNVEPGYPFMNRVRSNAPQAIADIFQQIGKEISELEKYHPDIKSHPGLMKGHVNFLGELLLGHLRYGTQGKK
jgi:amidophosphoribosyltransferase